MYDHRSNSELDSLTSSMSERPRRVDYTFQRLTVHWRNFELEFRDQLI
jgi:hypothetical protein